MLGEECLRQNYHSEATISETFINLLPEAIANLDLELVEPNAHSRAAQCVGKRQRNGLLVLRRVAQENIPLFQEFILKGRHLAHRDEKPRPSFFFRKEFTSSSQYMYWRIPQSNIRPGLPARRVGEERSTPLLSACPHPVP